MVLLQTQSGTMWHSTIVNVLSKYRNHGCSIVLCVFVRLTIEADVQCLFSVWQSESAKFGLLTTLVYPVVNTCSC